MRRTAFALLKGQSDVLKELRALPEAGVERSMALRSLFSEKATMLEAADRLEASLRRLAVDAERGGAPETGARLSETADAVTLIGLKIAWSRDLVQRADSDSSRYFEERIRADILQVQRQVIVGTAAFSRIELDRSTAYTLECR